MLESFPSKGLTGGRREDVFFQLRAQTKCPSLIDVRSISDMQTGIKVQIVKECRSRIIYVHRHVSQTQRVGAGCTFYEPLLLHHSNERPSSTSSKNQLHHGFRRS